MTEITYQVLEVKDEEDEEDDYYDDPREGVYRCEDDLAVELIGTDGGEPEDNTLRRDWSWVAPALQAAYELGRSHGLP